jgi:hypothetical protein
MREKLREGGSVMEGKRVRESEVKAEMRERALARGGRRRGRKREKKREKREAGHGGEERDSEIRCEVTTLNVSFNERESDW